jgi:MFS transporter, DHA1 family, multidrug resistance protein
MGRAGAVIGAAAVLGPALSGGLRQALGFTAVFVAVAGVLAAGAVLAYRGLPAERPAARGGEAAGDLRRLAGRAELQAACIAIFACTLAVGVLASFLPLHAESLGAAAAATGLLFTLYALVAGAVMLSGVARQVDRRGLAAPAAVGLLLLAAAMALLASSTAMPSTILAVALFGAGYGTVFPAASGHVATVTRPSERGPAFGLYNACFSLGIIVGPPVAGALALSLPAVDPFVVAVAGSGLGAVGVVARVRAAPRASPSAG